MTPPEPAAFRLLDAAAARLFHLLSVARRGRPFHPKGVAFHATLRVERDGGVPLLRESRELPAILRCSRSVGLPERSPDLFGAALRLVDAHGPGRHQDLLFVTGAAVGPLRHVLLPAYGYRNRTMSTIAPYELDGQACVFLLRAESGPGTAGRMTTLGQVAAGARSGTLRFELSVAPVLRGRPAPLGRLVVGEQLSDAEERLLTFNPVNSGGGLVPITLVNRLRPRSYAASQAARPALRRRGADPG